MEFRVLASVILALVATVGASPVVNFKETPEHLKYDTIESTRYLLIEDPKTKKIEYVDLLSQNITVKAQKSDVSYDLYSNSHSGAVIVKDVSDTTGYFDKTKKTLFITHGWNNDHTSAVNTEIRTAVLAKFDVNVFCTDWGVIANENYISAHSAVEDIGGFVGDFIAELMSHYGIDESSFLLVGHSLGAHVSGCAGARLNGKLDHIIGLDPAGPLYTIGNIDNRIDPSDAKFVQIIHTSDLLGFNRAIGHADYYPNGGNSQPGCGLDAAKTCAHGRSHKYYAESISSSDFIGHVCNSHSAFEAGACSSNTKSVMGQYTCSQITGTIHLNTNSESPFAMGDQI